MGFSESWLALREPVDHASIHPDVAAAAARALGHVPHLRVVDLGCGTGSNLRGLARHFGPRQHWRLVDHDPLLLAAAERRLAAWPRLEGMVIEVETQEADLTRVDWPALTAGAHLVTAAALFDLASRPVIERLVEAVAGHRQVFYTVLTYDGFADWAPAHRADPVMQEAFNRHQQGIKSFGKALGPRATDVLHQTFLARGYRILRGTSPWIIDDTHAELRRELDRGWAAAVSETGALSAAEVEDWLALRLAPGGRTTVGHEDLLAVPL